MKNTKKTLSVFALGILIGVGTFVSFTKADTIENFLTDISAKTLGLRIGGDVAFEKSLYVGDKVGIGTANPTEKLTVDGVIETSGGVKFADGTTLESANVESADFDELAPTTSAGDLIVNSGNSNNRLPIGADSQVLTVNGGAPSWENAYSGDKLTSKARTYLYGSQLIASGSQTKILFKDTNFDTKGEFNPTQNYFKSVEGGVYQVNVNAFLSSPRPINVLRLSIFVNGSAYLTTVNIEEYGSASLSDIVVLPANANVSVHIYQNSGSALNLSGGSSQTSFSIAQIQ